MHDLKEEEEEEEDAFLTSAGASLGVFFLIGSALAELGTGSSSAGASLDVLFLFVSALAEPGAGSSSSCVLSSCF